MRLATAAVVLLVVSGLCDGAQILALLTLGSSSHYFWSRSLLLELVRKGHHVTTLSPDAETTPLANLTNLLVTGVYEGLSADFDYIDMKRMSKWAAVDYCYGWASYVCQRTLMSDAAEELLRSSRRYDLILVESLLSECAFGFLHKFNDAPVVGLTAMGMPPWTHGTAGNPVNPAYVPTYDLPHSDHMTFVQRASNSLYLWYLLYTRRYVFLPQIDRMNREFFGPDVPPVDELEKKISMVLVNTQVGFNYPLPLVPAVVPVAGMHVKPPKPLPKDLQTFLDSSTKGVVYFNLGTNVKSSKLGTNVQKMLLEAFSELQENVLWKFETEDLKEIPKNVKISKWLPQTDILAHPNVLVFISHGGLLSTHEAVHRGVPVIGMPFFVDQVSNIANLEDRGVALELDYLTMTKDDVVRTIRQVIDNPSYKENMKKLSAIFRDQPETPLERAVYWTEYVLRHGGAPHLRSSALDLTWYQLLLLDIIGGSVLVVVVALVVIYVVLKIILRRVLGNPDTKKLKRN